MAAFHVETLESTPQLNNRKAAGETCRYNVPRKFISA
jgi:hypothetical protein